MEFEFVPFVGALPITFEMTPKEVAKIIGPPRNTTKNGRDLEEFRWSGKAPWMPLKMFYSSSGKLAELGFHPKSRVKYRGIDLCRDKDLMAKLMECDDEPMTVLDVILFLKLGIALSMDGDNRSNHCVGVFRKGRWKRFSDRFEPYKTK